MGYHIYFETRITYADTDQMKVVWHGNYLRFFEMARVELLRTLGMSYKEFEEIGFMLPVKEAFVDYKAPAKNDDIIRVKTWVGELRHASVKIMYEIYNKETNALLTKGYTLHPCVTTEAKVCRIPDNFYAIMQKGL